MFIFSPALNAEAKPPWLLIVFRGVRRLVGALPTAVVHQPSGHRQDGSLPGTIVKGRCMCILFSVGIVLFEGVK